jgi:hypothetical protein
VEDFHFEIHAATQWMDNVQIVVARALNVPEGSIEIKVNCKSSYLDFSENFFQGFPRNKIRRKFPRKESYEKNRSHCSQSNDQALERQLS